LFKTLPDLLVLMPFYPFLQKTGWQNIMMGATEVRESNDNAERHDTMSAACIVLIPELMARLTAKAGLLTYSFLRPPSHPPVQAKSG
jgi:hypothetical protein